MNVDKFTKYLPQLPFCLMLALLPRTSLSTPLKVSHSALPEVYAENIPLFCSLPLLGFYSSTGSCAVEMQESVDTCDIVALTQY